MSFTWPLSFLALAVVPAVALVALAQVAVLRRADASSTRPRGATADGRLG